MRRMKIADLLRVVLLLCTPFTHSNATPALGGNGAGNNGGEEILLVLHADSALNWIERAHRLGESEERLKLSSLSLSADTLIRKFRQAIQNTTVKFLSQSELLESCGTTQDPMTCALSRELSVVCKNDGSLESAIRPRILCRTESFKSLSAGGQMALSSHEFLVIAGIENQNVPFPSSSYAISTKLGEVSIEILSDHSIQCFKNLEDALPPECDLMIRFLRGQATPQTTEKIGGDRVTRHVREDGLLFSNTGLKYVSRILTETSGLPGITNRVALNLSHVTLKSRGFIGFERPGYKIASTLRGAEFSDFYYDGKSIISRQGDLVTGHKEFLGYSKSEILSLESIELREFDSKVYYRLTARRQPTRGQTDCEPKTVRYYGVFMGSFEVPQK